MIQKVNLILLISVIYNTLIYSQIPQNFVFHLDAAVQVQKDSTNSVRLWTDPKTSVSASQTQSNLQAIWIENGINKLPSLRFDGVQTYMNMPSVFPVDKDYTLVVICQAFAATSNIVGGTSRTLWMAGGTTPVVLHNGDFNNQAISKIDPGTEATLIIAHYRNSTQQVCFYVNGQFADSAFCPKNIDPTIYISAYQGGYVFNGDISEILLYDRYLSSTDRKQIETLFTQKYRIIQAGDFDSTFTEAPRTNQLYPRNKQNICEIPLSGHIVEGKWDSISVLVAKEKAILHTEGKKLNYISGKASFNWLFPIDAGLLNYSVEVKAYSATNDTVLLKSEKLVCGDVFIITGQSNSIFGGSTETDPFCRTFGKNYSTSIKDTLWTTASAAGYGGGPDVGAWGMHLAKLLIQKYQVPICIMNGGVGGTSIQQHQRNDLLPDQPSNIYGSLLYRMKKSKLANAAKGIFWYQGESNTGNLYFENFKALYEDWKLDYPNVEQVYVVQIHHGCGTGDNAPVREIQRQLPKNFPNIKIMSTNGLPGHDGCHYTVNGYNRLAEWLFPLVERDFYGAIPTDVIDPPNLYQAYYTNLQKNEIDLIFGPPRQDIVFPNDTTIQNINVRLKDYFAMDGQFVQVQSVKVLGDTIRLGLASRSTATKITYLPEIYYLNSNQIYQGPYITNSKGLGVFSFYNVPIQNQIILDSKENIHENYFKITYQSNRILLDIQDYSPENIFLHLINAQGQNVLRERVYLGTNFINTEQLPAGIYSVAIYERGQVVKVEKQILIKD